MSEEKNTGPEAHQMCKERIHEFFHGIVDVSIDEKGLETPHAVCLLDDGSVEIASLAVTAEQAYKWVLCTAASNEHVTDILMGLDRYTKPGQGNEFSDTIAGVHWTRAEAKKGTFKGFVIDYQFGPPKIVRPLNYENEFWNEIVKNEFQHCAKLMMKEAAKLRLEREQGGK